VKYAIENGSRAELKMCLRCAIGPVRSAKPNMNSRLPALNASANLCGLNAIMGGMTKKKENEKQMKEPTRHARKPRNLSHRLKLMNASSSLVRSALRSGTYPEMLLVTVERYEGRG